MTEKKTIRSVARANILAMSAEERLAASAAIFEKVAAMEVFGRARTVALYLSLSDEPRTDDFLARFCHDKRLVVPRVEAETINFYHYRAEQMRHGAFGILEPSPEALPCPACDIELMIVPGRAFTREGVRLGRGGGFYDRYLARPDLHALIVGVCFGTQIFDSLPAEPHDRPMDFVITGQ